MKQTYYMSPKTSVEDFINTLFENNEIDARSKPGIQNACDSLKINYLYEFKRTREAELRRQDGVGQKTLILLKKALIQLSIELNSIDEGDLPFSRYDSPEHKVNEIFKILHSSKNTISQPQSKRPLARQPRL